MSTPPRLSRSYRKPVPLDAHPFEMEQLAVGVTLDGGSSISDSIAPRLSHGDSASFESEVRPQSIPSTASESTAGLPHRLDDREEGREVPDDRDQSLVHLSAPQSPITPVSDKQPLRSTISLAEGKEEEFAEYRPPTEAQLREAANHELIDEDGNTVLFGEFYPDWSGELASDPHAGFVSSGTASEDQPRTVVFFIRTMACGQCQDYMSAAISRLDPDEIAASDVRVAIITNGGWKGLKKYSQLMINSKFKLYTDPDLGLYRLLGMNPKIARIDMLKGMFITPENRPAYHQSSTFVQLLKGLRTASKLGTTNLGSPTQMGGEFVLQPGYKCTYAHRMPNKFSHAPAKNVVGKAGVKWPEGRRVVENIPDPAIAAIEQEQLLEPSEEKAWVGWRRPIESKERVSVDKALPALPLTR